MINKKLKPSDMDKFLNIECTNKIDNTIINMINQFEKEGPDIILSQSVQSDTMKSNYFKVKNLYEKVQDTMNKNGYELSDEDIQNITNQLLDTFEEDKNLHKLNKVVDNTNDLLGNIATIIGTGLGFMMSTRIIVNEISSASNMQLSYTWIFGIAIGIISLTLKIISSYLAKKKLLKNMW